MTVSQCIRLAKKFQLCGACCNAWNGPAKGETTRDIKTVDDLKDDDGFTPDHSTSVIDVRDSHGRIVFKGNCCDTHEEIYSVDYGDVRRTKTLEAYSE